MSAPGVARVLSVALAVAGCGGAAQPQSSSRSAPAPVPVPPSGPVLPLARANECTTAVAAQHRLDRVQPRFLAMPGNPFGVATTADGLWSFVSIPGRPAGRIAVISDQAAVPRLVRTVALPAGTSAGLALTRDGRYLLLAAGSGALVISVARAERGQPDPVLGALSPVPNSQSAAAAPGGAFEVTTSADDRLAFVSLERAGRIAVFDLRAALAGGFRDRGWIGTIPLGTAPVGMTISPDGRWLYATSEAASGALGAAPSVGTLSLIDVRMAGSSPSRAVLATATAGCSPVRTTVSADGRVVWVAARSSDELLAFSTSKLRSDPRHALVAAVRVGESPLALALTSHGTRLVVADSDVSHTPGQTSGLTLVDTAAALAGRPSVLGRIRSATFPREMSVRPSGTSILVTNFGSRLLESVDLAAAP